MGVLNEKRCKNKVNETKQNKTALHYKVQLIFLEGVSFEIK